MEDSNRLAEILVTSRPLADYQRFFTLDPAGLVGLSVLDCPGGASSFTAEAAALGAAAMAADPVYGCTTDQIAELGAAQIDVSRDWFRQNPHLFYEDGQGEANIDSIIHRRVSALTQFVADYTANPERYEEASLPRLPFADNSFDLVLCSHFLFCYADRFELPFHLEALTELIRVSKSQVRIYPLADYLGNRPEWFADVLAWLTARGHRATVYPVDFRVMRNCTEMLLIEKHG